MEKDTNHQIEALELPGFLSRDYAVAGQEMKEEKYLLPGLSHINVFVGSNNSGKSRLLRGIMSGGKIRFVPREYGDNAIETAELLKKELSNIGPGQAVVEPFSSDVARLSTDGLVEEGENPYAAMKDIISKARDIRPHNLDITRSGGGSSKDLAETIKDVCNRAANILKGALEQLPNGFKFKRLYLPTLRGLRDITENHTDVYLEATKRSYFQNVSGDVEIFTGLPFYLELQNLLLGTAEQRRLVKNFETFLSDNIFDGQPVTLMPRNTSKVVWIRIGSESERPVHDLGDGVQHLIILTFPLFKNQKTPSLVFIEEPELFLHPGMQRALVKALKLFPRHQYFIATHSNHLLDLTIEMEDISIYMVRKKVAEGHEEDAPTKFEIEAASTHDGRLLEMLGTRVSSIFLTNCTVWVEGITDRRYLTHYLDLHVKHLLDVNKGKKFFVPRLDFHFSFVEYSGGNITHWSFLERTDDPVQVERLCARLMLIADKDDADWKQERQEELKKRLNERFVCLKCREVENLLTPEILMKVLVSYGEDTTAILPLVRSKYEGKPLGKYLDSRIAEGKAKRVYAEKSGTVKDKLNFCKKAIESMKNYEDLSTEAKELTERVYEFIKMHNAG